MTRRAVVMARKRFTPVERLVFVVGAEIEWRNGAHWHSGQVIGPIGVDSLGDSCFPMIHTGRKTSTVSPGQELRGYPGAVRGV